MIKLKAGIIAGGIGILTAFSRVNAQDVTTNTEQTTPAVTTITTTNVEYIAMPHLYRAQELSFDFFGTGTLGEQTIDHVSGDRIRHNGRLGAGIGANYFFCRYVGIGGDAYSEGTSHSFVYSTSGNLILRLPIGETGLAPYIFGGGGYQFDGVEQGFGQGGAGLEFRFTRNVGIFADARYVDADQSENYGVGRAGLRISF